MLLSREQVLGLDEGGLRAFLGRRAVEGQYVDYKTALSGDSEREQRREFLKDVTGFANAFGGHIIIGAKEPEKSASVDDQLEGIADGDRVAQALENVVRDCTDPRLPGFLVHPIKLVSGKWALVAHVPPSATRPHMVDFAGHRTFYVRRRSSTEPMTVNDIRESMLAAASAEARAREFVATRRAECLRYHQRPNTSHLLLQAVPLIQPDEAWPVEKPEIGHIVRGSDRLNRYHSNGICTNVSPRITMEGILAVNDWTNPVWVWEVHRSGYLSIMVEVRRRKPDGAKEALLLLHKGYHDPFFVLAEMLAQCWRVTGFDAPYMLAAEMFPANGAVFSTSGMWHEYSEPYWRDAIVWPLYMRPPGDDPQIVARRQIVDLYHAFGLHPPEKIEPPTSAR